MRHHARWIRVPDLLSLDIVSQYLVFYRRSPKSDLGYSIMPKNHIAAMAARHCGHYDLLPAFASAMPRATRYVSGIEFMISLLDCGGRDQAGAAHSLKLAPTTPK